MTPTPETIQQLIEELADKTLSLGCEVIYKNRGGQHRKKRILRAKGKNIMVEAHHVVGFVTFKSRIIKVLGHPVMLGDVLAKMESWTDEPFKSGKLCYLWKPFKLNRSLNEIFDSAEWEEVECSNCNSDGYTTEHNHDDMRPEHLENTGCYNCPVQMPCDNCRAIGTVKQIKDPHIRELFEYLCSLFLKTKP